MTEPLQIAFIGFGEAARAFVASLRPLGPLAGGGL